MEEDEETIYIHADNARDYTLSRIIASVHYISLWCSLCVLCGEKKNNNKKMNMLASFFYTTQIKMRAYFLSDDDFFIVLYFFIVK